MVVVGNLTVGGVGKTPVVAALCEWLQGQGLSAGIITRGYGGRNGHYPLAVTANTPVAECGDEALLLHLRTGAPVVVDPNRVAALNHLVQTYQVDVVISDDGLQHYPLPRDVEIVVVDGSRQFGNGHCLPVGPLREPVGRLNCVDLILQNGRGLGPVLPGAMVFDLQPDAWLNVQTGQALALNSFDRSVSYQAVAGIGNPARFFASLNELGVRYSAHEFGDHHLFTPMDLQALGDEPIVMTEKDAVKCRSFAQAHWWYLKVSAQLPAAFTEQLAKRLTHRLGSSNA